MAPFKTSAARSGSGAGALQDKQTGINKKMVDLLRENALFLGSLAVLVAGFLVLRTRGSGLASLDELDALISGGQPVLVEFYSNT
jgi:hypothetical protein